MDMKQSPAKYSGNLPRRKLESDCMLMKWISVGLIRSQPQRTDRRSTDP